MGDVTAEMFRFGSKWAGHAVNGDFKEGYDKRYYLHRGGNVTEGCADPT